MSQEPCNLCGTVARERELEVSVSVSGTVRGFRLLRCRRGLFLLALDPGRWVGYGLVPDRCYLLNPALRFWNWIGAGRGGGADLTVCAERPRSPSE